MCVCVCVRACVCVFLRGVGGGVVPNHKDYKILGSVLGSPPTLGNYHLLFVVDPKLPNGELQMPPT